VSIEPNPLDTIALRFPLLPLMPYSASQLVDIERNSMTESREGRCIPKTQEFDINKQE
jgi:hypothetical protein